MLYCPFTLLLHPPCIVSEATPLLEDASLGNVTAELCISVLMLNPKLLLMVYTGWYCPSSSRISLRWLLREASSVSMARCKSLVAVSHVRPSAVLSLWFSCSVTQSTSTSPSLLGSNFTCWYSYAPMSIYD